MKLLSEIFLHGMLCITTFYIAGVPIQLSDHFSYRRLFRFVLPSIGMLLFTSIYGVVDGFFVSNYAGKQAFAAVNLVMPVLMILGSIGFMFGAGGSALVAAQLGQKKEREANENFSLIVYSTAVCGIAISFVGFLLLKPMMELIGAEGELLENCLIYGRITLCSMTAYMLQNMFQTFLITAEKPQMGFVVTLIAGMTNIFLDFLFVGIFLWGLKGAAIATVISECLGGFIPLLYFIQKKNSLLHLGKSRFAPKVLVKTCTNGASELLSGIAASVMGILYNFQLMRFSGENGVAAYGVIMYVSFVFFSLFIGYSTGCAPLTSYHYGANNRAELQNLFKKSCRIIGTTSVSLFVLAQLFARPLSGIFVGYDAELWNLTEHGFRICSTTFLFGGFCVYASSLFTALNNGLLSATISVSRTILFETAAVLILPQFFGVNGIWFSIFVTEVAAISLSAFFVVFKRKQYGYA